MLKKIVLMTLVLTLLLTGCGGKSSVSNNAGSADLSGALNLLLGTTDEPSVFDSYHLEMVLDTPKASDDETAVVNEVVSISADIVGENVHIFQVDPGMTEAKEGYIIGDTDKEYKLIDGVWEETMGQIGLAWAMWPLQVVMPYATISSLYAQKTGEEEIDGRSTTVYDLDTSKADASTLAGMQAVGVNITGKGQVWIDDETGAMVKLDLEYTNDITNMDGSVALGSGTGHITLEVTQVGQVTVTSPQ